ncbi:uncharacterized protein LOC121880277 isoform X2 [Homarus americanus]|uniref:uncharacterized protein LOC121880277 isoform X2 n=1 Tax=Homarus americanus TaxID=6706 RepID=UPI001C45EF7A|nr:uncharacterized protein LOC121880277 isoform X2 [Homarus americanus]
MDNMVVKELAVVLGALCWVLTLATDGHGCTPWVTTETNNDWQGVNFKNPAKYLWFQADKRRTLTKIYIDFFQNDGSDRVNRDLWFTVPSNTSYYVGVIKPKLKDRISLKCLRMSLQCPKVTKLRLLLLCRLHWELWDWALWWPSASSVPCSENVQLLPLHLLLLPRLLVLMTTPGQQTLSS